MKLKFDFNLYRYVMIIFEDNWADEISIKSLWVTPGENFKEFIDITTKNINHILQTSHSCGTNEELEYDNENDFWTCFKFKSVSEQFYKDFKKHIGSEEYGGFSITRFMEV